jgi:hypothetical protein
VARNHSLVPVVRRLVGSIRGQVCQIKYHSRALTWVDVNVANDQRTSTSRGQAQRLFYARTSCLWMDLSGMSMDGIEKSRKGFYLVQRV